MEKNIFEVVPINEEPEESLNFDVKEACSKDLCTWVDFCSASGCEDFCTIDFSG